MSLKLYGIISKVMSVPVSEINDQTSLETIPEWDSFNALVLLGELETEYKIKFTLSEITDFKKVADIKKYLGNHGAILND